VKLAPRVRPVGDGGDGAGLSVRVIEPLESGIGVGLQEAGKRLQVLARPLAFAVRAVAEQRSGLVA